MNKPFHLMTPAERTAHRIAQNKAIDERVDAVKSDKTTVTKSGRGSSGSAAKAKKPPAQSNAVAGFTRATPDEHAALGGVIRKVRS